MFAALSLCAAATAATDIVADLKSRLANDGLEAVNAYLSGHWESAMAPLSRKVERCDIQAMQLTLELHRGTNAETAQALGESLSLAVSRCPAKLLPLIPSSEVQQFCNVGGAVPESRVKREIARRVHRLSLNAPLSRSQNGLACITAYKEEARRAALGPWQTDSLNGRPTK